MANKVLRGATVRIGESEFDCPNVIEEITTAMEEDQENPDTSSALVISSYHGLTQDQKEAVDDIVSAICGWSLPTLIRNAGAKADLLNAMSIPQDAPKLPEGDADDDGDER